MSAYTKIKIRRYKRMYNGDNSSVIEIHEIRSECLKWWKSHSGNGDFDLLEWWESR